MEERRGHGRQPVVRPHRPAVKTSSTQLTSVSRPHVAHESTVSTALRKEYARVRAELARPSRGDDYDAPCGVFPALPMPWHWSGHQHDQCRVAEVLPVTATRETGRGLKNGFSGVLGLSCQSEERLLRREDAASGRARVRRRWRRGRVVVRLTSPGLRRRPAHAPHHQPSAAMPKLPRAAQAAGQERLASACETCGWNRRCGPSRWIPIVGSLRGSRHPGPTSPCISPSQLTVSPATSKGLPIAL